MPVPMPIIVDTSRNISTKELCVIHHLSVQDCNELQRLRTEERNDHIKVTAPILIIIAFIIFIIYKLR